MDEGSRAEPIAQRAPNARIAAAFVALLAGVLAGALFEPRPWAWALPVAGFVGYVFAFRSCLACTPDLDALWREAGREWPPNPPHERAGERQR